MAQIEVTNLSKQFKYSKKDVGLAGSVKNLFHREYLFKEAVKNISFEIEEGEFVGFLGPNGAGKTTTLKMLSGILYPTSGDVQIMGYIPWERKIEYKRNFSIIMGQKNQLWWDLPARETLFLNKHIYEISDQQYNNNVEYLSELLDVKKVLDVQVRRLSLGERMKLELIAALLHNPKVIFMDEPTIGLDITSQKKIRDFLKKYNEDYKATVILTSHYMKDIEDLCNRAIVINDGSVVYDGTKEGINELYARKKVLELSFESAIITDELEKYGKILSSSDYKACLEVDKEEVRQITADVMLKYALTDLEIRDIPLEEGLELLYEQ